MDIQKDLMDKKIAIDKMIEDFFPRELTEESANHILGKPVYKYDIKTLNEAMFKPMWEFLDRGGKRWRPYLFLLIIETFGTEEEYEKFKKLCIVPEIVHNGTLIVDDFEDMSELRRGKPTLHKMYGDDLAINIGNSMYYLPLLSAIKMNIEPEILSKYLTVYIEEMINVSMGQGTDIYWSRGTIPSEDEYLQMCFNKTGCLARMSARLAATLVGLPEEMVNTLGKWAGTIGVSFQIKDDILNIKPSSDDWGKAVGDDITEGKRTLMVIHAMKDLSNNEKEELENILEQHTRDSTLIKRAIELIMKNDSIDYSQTVASDLLEQSWNEVAIILPPDKSEKLKAFSEFLLHRSI